MDCERERPCERAIAGATRRREQHPDLSQANARGLLNDTGETELQSGAERERRVSCERQVDVRRAPSVDCPHFGPSEL